MTEDYSIAATVFIRRFALACLACNFVTAFAYADLYTGGQLSIEWLVDSCDRIFIVEVAEPTQVEKIPVFELKETLKGTQSTESLQTDLSFHDSRWIVRASQTGDQWMCFLRSEQSEGDQVVKVINLSHPRRWSSTAAITGKGEILSSKKAIIKAVSNRMELGRKLPPRCRPSSVDATAIGKGLKSFRYELSPSAVEHYMGGFSVEVTCDYWDSPEDPNDRDEDLLITHVAVPADQVYRQLLLDKIKAIQTGVYISKREEIVYALGNYQDEEVRTVLQALAGKRSQFKARTPNEEFAGKAAHVVLQYWNFLEATKNPINKKLVGKWELDYGRPTEQFRSPGVKFAPLAITLLLHADNSLEATAFEVSSGDEKLKKVWKGVGYWSVRDNKLTAIRTRADKSYVGMDEYELTLLEHAILNVDRMVASDLKSERTATRLGGLPKTND